MRPKLSSAFSLIELTLSVGIISFCLVAIMGLFSIGLTASRESTNDRIQAAIVSRLYTEMRGFSAFTMGEDRYFDEDGVSLTNNEGATFACRFTESEVTDAEIPMVAPYLRRVAIEVTWPAALPRSTNTYYVPLPAP